MNHFALEKLEQRLLFSGSIMPVAPAPPVLGDGPALSSPAVIVDFGLSAQAKTETAAESFVDLLAQCDPNRSPLSVQEHNGAGAGVPDADHSATVVHPVNRLPLEMIGEDGIQATQTDESTARGLGQVAAKAFLPGELTIAQRSSGTDKSVTSGQSDETAKAASSPNATADNSATDSRQLIKTVSNSYLSRSDATSSSQPAGGEQVPSDRLSPREAEALQEAAEEQSSVVWSLEPYTAQLSPAALERMIRSSLSGETEAIGSQRTSSYDANVVDLIAGFEGFAGLPDLVGSSLLELEVDDLLANPLDESPFLLS